MQTVEVVCLVLYRLRARLDGRSEGEVDVGKRGGGQNDGGEGALGRTTRWHWGGRRSGKHMEKGAKRGGSARGGGARAVALVAVALERRRR
jgi:hypothetical protein